MRGGGLKRKSVFSHFIATICALFAHNETESCCNKIFRACLVEAPVVPVISAGSVVASLAMEGMKNEG